MSKNTETVSALEFCRDALLTAELNARIIRGLEARWYGARGGPRPDGMPRGAGAGRPAEDAAIRIPDAVHRAIEELNRENAYIGRLYGAVMAGLAKLPYLQRTILHDFYIDGKRWDVVARRHNYGERHCQRIRDDGLTALGGLLAADPAAKKFFKK